MTLDKLTTMQEITDVGNRWVQHRMYHAALEVFYLQLKQGRDNPAWQGDLLLEIGRIHVLLGQDATALYFFHQALESHLAPAVALKGAMLLALVNLRLGNADLAYRLMTEAYDRFGKDLMPWQAGVFYNNLALIQYANGFSRQALQTQYQAITLLHSVNNHQFDSQLYHTLGTFLMELGDLPVAKRSLRRATATDPNESLSALLDLGRLYILTKSPLRATVIARRAADRVWSSVMEFTREEVARLCRMIAHLTSSVGDLPLALQALEKSQLLFGQMGAWQEWQQTLHTQEVWTKQLDKSHPLETSLTTHEVHRFLMILDAIHAQQVVNPQFARELDARALYAHMLACHIKLPTPTCVKIAVAARMADYGLTALDPQTVTQPERSSQAWQSYQQHPLLSLQLLASAGLSQEVQDLIANHHEWLDGSGYPLGKSGDDISVASQVLAAAETYAQAVVTQRQAHSRALRQVSDVSGRRFSNEIGLALVTMFQGGCNNGEKNEC
ncbi:hypothetical protein D2Q93_09970 [Alicyclobacillaceae bacterium I2511]|nr:hypothetical protein D2Q93_09970 [Alicyclobacillaceae bacterium I2511]